MTRTGADAGDRERGAFVRDRLGVDRPVAALVLGSGLGQLTARVERPRRLPYDAIPGVSAPRVAGHAGEIVAGTLGGREVLVLSGRLHLYEGHDAWTAALPARLAHAAGASTLFVSNAAGAIRRGFGPGTLMLIADHLDMTMRGPFAGTLPAGGSRSAMHEPYDAALRAVLRTAALRAGVALEEGVYAWVQGPSYETPAEIRMLQRLGADVVGMSTVPEVTAARSLGMRVAALSIVTNLAAGIGAAPLRHDDVLDVTARAARRFEDVVEGWVSALQEARRAFR
ncbi:MAG TPA: purine-nucleoside phosphorylase [Gemmatimonadaceae bacterium]|nr:purine-nucleoside phosphorylase [Gemmatimonadaceae bacterium]